jgi:hypothetical protein
VRVLAKEGAGTDNNINTIHTSLNSNLDIIHVTANMGQDLCLETKLADGNTVQTRLLRGTRRCEFNTVDAKVVKGLCNLDLGGLVKVGIGKLLALA